MGLILNLETATTVCSVALARDGELINFREVNEGYTHSENLTSFIEEIIKEEGIKISDIDAIAISKGPGSYTGLRIGVSAAKGLCLALDKPLISINTLHQMSFSVSSTKKTESDYLCCPMLDARRMEVYCAVYTADSKEVISTTAKIIDSNSFSDLLRNNKMFFFGDGALKCKPFLDKHSNSIFVDSVFPSARMMITIAENKFNKRDFEDVAYFEPFYLKDFVGMKKIV